MSLGNHDIQPHGAHSAGETPASRYGMLALIALAVAGMAAWGVLYALGDRARLWQSLLVAFVYFAPLSGGLVVWSAVVNLSHGRWTGPLEKPTLWGLGGSAVAVALFVLLAVLFVPSWSARYENPTWAIWQVDRVPDPGKDFWLGTGFLFARNGAALLVFWIAAAMYVRQRMRGRPARGLAVGVVLLYALSMSLIGSDLVMGLDPVWFSSLMPPYVLISGVYIATAAWAVLAADSGLLRPAARRHDLGKLLVAFSLLTTYMMYGQLLCIWYGNLPPELRFVVPRLTHPPMRYVSLLLLGTVYLGPLVLMLPRGVKRRPAPLLLMAMWVLVFMYVERWWLIVPTFSQGRDVISLPIDFHAGDLAVAIAAGAWTVLGIGVVRRACPVGTNSDDAEKNIGIEETLPNGLPVCAVDGGKQQNVRCTQPPTAQTGKPLGDISHTPASVPVSSWRPAALLALLLWMTLLGAAAVFFLPWPAAIGPEQPVAFSHRVHAGVKQISCVFCHPGVIDRPHATVPPVATCMLCHQKVIPEHPEIVKVRRAFESDRPIAWVKANAVPAFVYFTHERHVRQGVDCGRCHGNVTAMDRLAPAAELNMGLCIQCHRDNRASVDCYMCHR